MRNKAIRGKETVWKMEDLTKAKIAQMNRANLAIQTDSKHFLRWEWHEY